MNLVAVSSSGLALSIEAIGWTLLHFVWQGAVAGLALFVVLVLARNSSAQLRYLAACGALGLMFAAAVSTFIWQINAVVRTTARPPMVAPGVASLPAAENDGVASLTVNRSESLAVATSVTAQSANHAGPAGQAIVTVGNTSALLRLLSSFPEAAARWTRRLEPWLPSIVRLWALGVAFFSLRLLIGWRAVRGLCAAGGAFPDEYWLARFAALKERVGLAFPVRLISSTSAAVPMVIGWLKPVVLVPAGLAAGLSAAQLEAVLLHELIHIRRHDYLVNLLQNVLETVFFYHPAVAWVSSRIRVEREHCCDDAASLACGGTLDYARALAALAQLRRAPMLGLAANGGSLVERVRRLVAATETDDRRGMSSGAATLLSLTVSGIALAALGAAVAEQQAPAERAMEPNRAANKSAAPTATPDNVIAVRGKVLRPDGRPAAGAKVFARNNFRTVRENGDQSPSTSAGPKGEFSLRIPALKREDGLPMAWWLAAQTPGFGLQWTTVGGSNGNPTEPVLLKLLPEVPLHGRIVDLEGRPVRDVQVKVIQQRVGKIGGGRPPIIDDDSQPPVQTDADGRFVLRGVGADRVAVAEIRGETIAYARIFVNTRTNQERPSQGVRGETNQIFGPDFTFVANPTKPVIGTVRDADTGRPLAGVTIESDTIAGKRFVPPDPVRTVTDAQGRYRLVGLSKGPGPGMNTFGNEIAVVPNSDQPYFLNRIEVPDTPGLAPVRLDIALKRGVWITGRVTDKVSGRPVPSSVVYFPFRSNPFANDRPEFKRRMFRINDVTRIATRPDGSFRIVGLPGRGIVAANAVAWAARSTPRALSGSYLKGVGASEIAGMNKNGEFPTFELPFRAGAKENDSLKELNPAAGTESIVCNLALDPGGTLPIHLVDRQGKPVEMCGVIEVQRAMHMGIGASRESTFDLTGLSPHESRALFIWQADRKIGKVLTVRYDEKGPRAITVTLEPCATVKGRLVDEDGVPMKDLRITARAHVGGANFPSVLGRQFNCDSEGRFVDAELAPGCDYYSLQSVGREVGMPIVADKIAVVAGQTIDLGDVKVKRRRIE